MTKVRPWGTYARTISPPLLATTKRPILLLSCAGMAVTEALIRLIKKLAHFALFTEIDRMLCPEYFQRFSASLAL